MLPAGALRGCAVCAGLPCSVNRPFTIVSIFCESPASNCGLFRFAGQTCPEDQIQGAMIENYDY